MTVGGSHDLLFILSIERSWMKGNDLTVVPGEVTTEIRPRTQPPHTAIETTEDHGIFFLIVQWQPDASTSGCFPTTPLLPPIPKHIPWANPEGNSVYRAQLRSRKDILAAAGLQLPCWGRACFSEFVCQIHMCSNGPSHREVWSASLTTSSLL